MPYFISKLLALQLHHVLTHHHPLCVHFQFQLFYRLSSICNFGHVVGHAASFLLKSVSLQTFKNQMLSSLQTCLRVYSAHTARTVCGNLLKVSVPWLESVSICSLILFPGSQLQVAQGGSQRRRRAGEGRQSSFPMGGHPLAVNTPNINMNLLLFQNMFVKMQRFNAIILHYVSTLIILCCLDSQTRCKISIFLNLLEKSE